MRLKDERIINVCSYVSVEVAAPLI